MRKWRRSASRTDRKRQRDSVMKVRVWQGTGEKGRVKVGTLFHKMQATSRQFFMFRTFNCVHCGRLWPVKNIHGGISSVPIYIH